MLGRATFANVPTLMIIVALVIAATIGLGVELAPLSATDLLARLPAGAPAPEAQAVTRSETTVTLTRAVALESHTVVEFTIEAPQFAPAADRAEVSLVSPVPGQDILLQGFAEAEVKRRQLIHQNGAVHLMLEIPPPAALGDSVSVTIERLAVYQSTSDRVQPFDGPWHFEFVPCAATERLPRLGLKAPDTC